MLIYTIAYVVAHAFMRCVRLFARVVTRIGGGRSANVIGVIAAAALLVCSCGTVDPSGISTGANGITFDASREIVVYHDGISDGKSVEIRAYAPGSVSPVDAGEVTVNGGAITRRSDLATGGVFYAAGWKYADDAPISTDSTMQYLALGGGDQFAPFADSIRAPKSVDMLEPGVASSISKSQGCTVRWRGTNVPGDSVQIEIHDGIVAILLRQRVPDTGIAHLAASDLNGVPYGTVLIGVNRSTSRISTHSDGRRASMAVTSSMFMEVSVGA